MVQPARSFWPIRALWASPSFCRCSMAFISAAAGIRGAITQGGDPYALESAAASRNLRETLRVTKALSSQSSVPSWSASSSSPSASSAAK